MVVVSGSNHRMLIEFTHYKEYFTIISFSKSNKKALIYSSLILYSKYLRF